MTITSKNTIFSSKIGFGESIIGEAVVVSEQELGSRNLTMDLSGKILILTTSPSKEFLEKAGFVGVLGVCVPEIHARDFDYFKSIGDFGMMVFQKFGTGSLSADLMEKIVKLNGRKVELQGRAHELKIV